MSSKPTHRSVAVLDVPKQVPALINFARRVVTGMDGNPLFPNPSPPLLDITAAANDLEAAEAQALKRSHGAAAARDEKRSTLVGKLQLLKGYVQAIADASALQAGGIITSAAMSVRKVATRQKRVFAAKPGAVAGSVVVSTPSAGRRVSYDWQYSTDAGKTWILLPTTLQARTSVSGLQAGTYFFRFRVVTKSGVGDWSNPVSLTLR